jgi:hypothetical protein
MKLPAERVKPLLQIGGIERQLAGNFEKLEIVTRRRLQRPATLAKARGDTLAAVPARICNCFQIGRRLRFGEEAAPLR